LPRLPTLRISFSDPPDQWVSAGGQFYRDSLTTRRRVLTAMAWRILVAA
jgi:hypothetical protein